MGPRNRHRDPGDAPPFAVAASPWRTFARAIAIAAALHVPLVPTGLTAVFDRLLGKHFADYDDADAGIVIPIDLDLLHDPRAEEGAPPPAAAAQPAASAAPSADGPGPAPAPSEKPAAPPTKHALADAGAPADAGAHPLEDPVSAAGSVGKLAAKDANVQVLVASDRLRKHELGMNFAKLLVNLPEWASFFAGTGIDPLRDFDHLLIAGPKFKHDSSKVVAVMDYHVSDDVVRGGIEAIVARGGGAWLEGTPMPAARAKAAGRERIFALLPKKHLVAILPEGALDQLEAFEKTKGFARSSKVGLVVSMVNPARPMAELMPLPTTLAWMRLAFTPTDDGGGDLRLELGDASPEDAEKDVKDIEASYDKARKIEVPILGAVEVLDRATFTVEGKVIRADIKVKEMQLRQILAFASARYAAPPAAAVSASAAASAAPALSSAPSAPAAASSAPSTPAAAPSGP